MDRREAEEKARRAAEAEEAHRRKLYGMDYAPASRKKSMESEPSDTGVVDELGQLRKELNTVVSIAAQRSGRPHGAIHTEVRKACGGPPTALCSAEQLRERIEYLRKW